MVVQDYSVNNFVLPLTLRNFAKMLQWYICCHSRLYSLVVPTERSDEGTKNDKEISHIRSI